MTTPPTPPLRLLFVCVENSNRSQMAEAFARMHGAEVVEVASAGSRPSGTVNPKAIAAMAERGYDLRQHRSKSLDDVQSTIKKLVRDRIQAILLLPSYLTVQHREPIIKGLAAEKVPVVSAGRDMAETGALLTYSPDFFDLWRRSGVYVDKILKGTKPGDLPIQQATKFELIVNLKTAKALNVTIPDSILVRADHVIQ